MSSTVAVPTVADYQQAWAHSAKDILSQAAARKLTCELETFRGGTPSAETSAFCACFSLGEPLRGQTAVFLGAPDALNLAQLFLGETPNSSAELSSVHHDALGELFRQLGTALSASLTAILGERTSVSSSGSNLPSWVGSASGFAIRLSGPSFSQVTLQVALGPDLNDLFAEEPQQPRNPRGEFSASACREPNLEFLKDVEVGVSLRFGKTSLPLREVLEIMPGAVLQLDQHLHEPVELLVGRKVVARGEVVVVDDSYGLQITDVVSPGERMDSLCG